MKFAQYPSFYCNILVSMLFNFPKYSLFLFYSTVPLYYTIEVTPLLLNRQTDKIIETMMKFFRTVQ